MTPPDELTSLLPSPGAGRQRSLLGYCGPDLDCGPKLPDLLFELSAFLHELGYAARYQLMRGANDPVSAGEWF